MLQAQDFKTKQEVRWCPGCGNYAILSVMQKLLPKIGLPREKIVIVSGIGCSGRFPYYMNTYGFHTIHGRAPAIATGLKLARPDLSIWVVIGDGDGLSIGANHLYHAIRRNCDIKIILINNKIYGLTKGQFSPTSDKGLVTSTSPNGKKEDSANPITFALSAGGTFVARGIDNDTKNLEDILYTAAFHKGLAFVEILQDCHVFNPTAFDDIKNKRLREGNTVLLNHGKPLIFGKNFDKAVVLSDGKISIKNIHENNSVDLTNHDVSNEFYAYMLSRLSRPEFPLPIGIFRDVKKEIYDSPEIYFNSDSKKIINQAIATIVGRK